MQLNEALEVHSELNPLLFDDFKLKEDVKEKLLEIANTFIEGLDYPLNVADIRFLGSNASFNYNENSDIDLHIITNFDLMYVDDDILQTLYNASKNSFNRNHNITIKGIPVELYIEDMNSMNATNGSYSLLQDDWIKIPQPIKYEIPDYSKELELMEDEIDSVLDSGSKEEVEELINRIYLGRKDGLATEGEASIGNCVFKELRNLGLIDKLRERFYELESQELTLENKLVESFEMNGLSKTVNDALKNEDDKKKQEKIKEYEDYINEHIENVHKAYDRIVKNFVKDEFTDEQLKQLETNLDSHDKDKTIPFMFDAYRRNHLPINDKEKEDADEDYDIAWSYHKTHNTHHWEYWLNSAGEFAQDINEEEMKLAYAEMLCDWLSFGFKKEKESATGESTEFEVWYNESKKNIKIHPQLEDWLNDKISQIIEYINSNKETLYESKKDVTKHLTKFESYDNIDRDDVNIDGKEENKMTDIEIQKERKRMQEWVDKILEGRKLEESSMSKVAEYISHYQVGFITAFRQGNTKATNQDRNYNLKLDIIQDLNKTNLSYIKVDGTYPEQAKDKDGNDISNSYVQIFEETFAVINDQYISDDFIKIMCNLANKYNQDSTLIVFPPADTVRKIEDNITAAEYDGNGNKIATYKGFTISVYDKYKDRNPDIMEYYTKVGNKKLSFTNRQEVNECIDKEPKFDVLTYRLKKSGNQGSMLEAQRKHNYVEKLLVELNSYKLQEMKYSEFKKDNNFQLDYKVEVPLQMIQENDFDVYEDDRGRDIEMDVDIDSLYEGFDEAEKEIDSMFNDEDWLKTIFEHVGLGRVYPELISLEEDKLVFNIGFSNIVDPVEKDNELYLNEKEIKAQIEELAEGILDNLSLIDAKQYCDVATGDVDEDGDGIYEQEYSDEEVSYRLVKNGEIKIKSLITESKKIEESNLSRIFNHYENTPFIVISAERPDADNKKNTLSLKNDIRSAGFGYIPVDGAWKEEGVVSSEYSFFIPMPSSANFDDFFKWGISMCKKYNQDSVLISNGEDNVSYFDQYGNSKMSFSNGISFNQNTIDKNIDDANGVGGFTSLNKKKANKSFQLQQLKIDRNTIQNLLKNNSKCDVLNTYINEYGGNFDENQLQLLISLIYNSTLDLKDSGSVDLDDCKLNYDKSDYGFKVSLREDKDLIRYRNHSQRDALFNKHYADTVKIEESDDNYSILNKYKEADYGYINNRDLQFILKTLYGKDTELSDGVNNYSDVELTFDRNRITDLKRK